MQVARSGDRQVRLGQSFAGLGIGKTSFVHRPFGATMLLPHACVAPTKCQKVLVRATLRNRAIMQDDDLVRVGDGREPVTGSTISGPLRKQGQIRDLRNNQQRATLPEVSTNQLGLDLLLRLAVQGRRGLV